MSWQVPNFTLHTSRVICYFTKFINVIRDSAQNNSVIFMAVHISIMNYITKTVDDKHLCSFFAVKFCIECLTSSCYPLLACGMWAWVCLCIYVLGLDEVYTYQLAYTRFLIPSVHLCLDTVHVYTTISFVRFTLWLTYLEEYPMKMFIICIIWSYWLQFNIFA